jgi:hypothetical protein
VTVETAKVRFARRFVITSPGQGEIHGVQFPSGRVLADYPDAPLTAAMSIEALVGDAADVTIHWADEEFADQSPPGAAPRQ